MKIFSKASIGIIASLFISQAFSAPTSSRNTLQYNLKDFALHTITTNPIQPFQPVYAWRTHTRFDGSQGIHTQSKKMIGETNGQGILNIVVQSLPHDGIHCGFFINERVAVGDPDGVKSNALSFTIRDLSPHPGPMHPDIGCGGIFGGHR